MEKSYFQIAHIPAILWGEPSDKIFLFVHGRCGSKEDAARFGEIAETKGWQVLSVDLPEHGERGLEKDSFLPWRIAPELQNTMLHLRSKWEKIALCANSIGAWFSMTAFEKEAFEKCLFVSPLLDMELVIRDRMHQASVSEEALYRAQEIKTESGETLSWRYLMYAGEHPVIKWDSPTEILYAENDEFTERYVVDAFCSRFHAGLTVMEKGEHWFHTPEQLAFLDRWIKTHV